MKKKRILTALILVGFGIGGFALRPASATVPNTITELSLDTGSGNANDTSSKPEISGDGRFVVFDSVATDLVTSDTNGWADVFIRDRTSGATNLVSATSGGTQGNSSSSHQAISHNGRYVTFMSGASNLVAGDTNSNGDVFVKDLQTGTLTIASKSAAGTLGNGFSHSPHISADGRFVTFLSDATNLVSGLSTPINQQVYIKDLKTGAIKHLSPSTSGGKSNGDSFKPRISCDGGIVAFTSTASNLVSGDTNGRKDVFVYELGGESAELTDITLSANDDSADAVVSCDGNKIAYSTRATNISGTDANGGLSDVYVYDRTLQTHTLASTSTGGTQGNKTSQYPSISGDGRFVSFTSESTNFVSNDNHDFTDIYLRDVKYSTTELISINTGGSSTPPGTANTLGWAGQGDLSVISADATTVAFSGVGNFIVTGDNDGIKDIYAAATGRD